MSRITTSLITPGFCFKVLCQDAHQTKLFVNVCGHQQVGAPQTKSGSCVDADFIDANGIDNLAIPIAVGDVLKDQQNSSLSSDGKPVAVVCLDEEGEGKSRTPSSTAAEGGGPSLYIDVNVWPSLAKRCYPSHHQYQHLVSRLVDLALHWVLQETGMMVNKTSVKVMQNVKYKKPKANSTGGAATQNNEKGEGGESGLGGGKLGGPDIDVHQVMKTAEEMYQSMQKQQEEKMEGKEQQEGEKQKNAESVDGLSAATTDSGVRLPDRFNVTSSSVNPDEKNEKKKSPLVQEISSTTNNEDGTTTTTKKASTTAVKKGFLLDSAAKGKTIYGPAGSSEGNLPDGAGDPLGYMPKAFRDKCKIVDLRNEENPQAAAQKMMSQQKQEEEKRDSKNVLPSSQKNGNSKNDVNVKSSVFPEEVDQLLKEALQEREKERKEQTTKKSSMENKGIIIEDVLDDDDVVVSLPYTCVLLEEEGEGGIPCDKPPLRCLIEVSLPLEVHSMKDLEATDIEESGITLSWRNKNQLGEKKEEQEVDSSTLSFFKLKFWDALQQVISFQSSSVLKQKIAQFSGTMDENCVEAKFVKSKHLLRLKCVEKKTK